MMVNVERRFAADAQAFVELVDALLGDETKRQEFARDPIATLERHGIRFPDSQARAEIGERLKEAAQCGEGEGVMGVVAWTRPVVKIVTYGTMPIVEVITKVCSDRIGFGDIDKALEVDTGRVSQSVEIAVLNRRILALEEEVLRLQKREPS
jgi:hypothetical protein